MFPEPLYPYHLTYHIIIQMRPCKLCRYVNKSLIPKLQIEDTISETTAVCWLKKLGFKLSRVQKGVYVDGHEQPDVVEARKKFINYMETNVFLCVFYMLILYIFINIAHVRYCYKYEGDNMETALPPDLKPGKKIHYPIFHDECCIHANDQCTYVWM